MMKWVATVMWAFSAFAGNLFTLVGLMGLVFFAGIGVKRFYDHLLYEEEPHEDQH